MNQFTTPLKVEFIDGEFWRLTDELSFYTSDLEYTIVVPKGFLTDFASIPRWAWPIIGHPTGPYGCAAVVHDWIYALSAPELLGYLNSYVDLDPPLSRKEGDQMFLDGMEVLGIEWWRKTLMYSAVRVGGNGGWGENRKKVDVSNLVD